MAKKIVINPLTRISGFMEVEAIIENNKVVEAKTSGLLFRGFEKMLIGRKPFDAIYFTERICGICSSAHSIASTMALESAMNIVPSEQGRYLRDIIHGSEFIQNHLRHFYQYTAPDFVKLPESYTLYTTDHKDFRLPKEKNDLIVKHYFESLDISRQAHEMLAVLGGKAPHNHGVFVGGITTQASADKIIKIKSIISLIDQFIKDKMIPDIFTIAEYYPEYYHNGGGYGNLLTYGSFSGYKDLGTLYVNPLVYYAGSIQTFNPGKITEATDYSWYAESNMPYKPYETVVDVNTSKPEAYTWIKAARYIGLPFEVGPLARQWLSGEYRNGISTMDRVIARVLEAKKVCEVMTVLLNNLIPDVSVQEEYTIPQKAEGAGLIDTTRGALSHWIKIDNEVISFYQIITPSGWNFSPRSNNLKGTAEQTLIGTTIENPENPVEIGRVLRSFDPCVSCATHVYSDGMHLKTIQVMP